MTDATVDNGETELDPLAETPAVTDPAKPEETPGESSTPVETTGDKATDPVQARINKITADKYAEKRRADAAEARIKELEGNREQSQAPTSEAPKLEDFDFDETKFNEATIQYQVQKQLAAQATQQNQQTADEAKRTQATDFAAKEVEFGKAHPDYSEVVQNIPQLHPDTLDVIYSMDNGPEMAHYLGSHLDVADQIATMSPVMAAMKLGQIAGTLASATKQTVTTTSAPEPVTTLSGAGGVTKDLDDMSMDEIMTL